MKNICSELNKPINYINMNLLILFNIFGFGIETIQHVENDEIPICIVNAFKQNCFFIYYITARVTKHLRKIFKTGICLVG